MLSFLADKEQYITFSANSPIELSWTTTITEANEQSSNFASAWPQSFTGGFDVSGVLAGVVLAHVELDYDAAWGGTLSLGKVSTSSHDFDRTVTIKLDDGDLGDF